MYENARFGFILPVVQFQHKTSRPINSYESEIKTSFDYFGGKRVILFSVQGAFSSINGTQQLLRFEYYYDEFMKFGINEVYCIAAMNDCHVMNAWKNYNKIKKVKMISDNDGEFTDEVGMISLTDSGLGFRSWYYAAIVDSGMIENWFEEPGYKSIYVGKDEPIVCSKEPESLVVATPIKILDYLRKV